MTPDELRETVARAICDAAYSHIKLSIDPFEPDRDHWELLADAAIALIRAEALEEAANEAERVVAYATSQAVMRENIAAAIRALKETREVTS